MSLRRGTGLGALAVITAVTLGAAAPAGAEARAEAEAQSEAQSEGQTAAVGSLAQQAGAEAPAPGPGQDPAQGTPGEMAEAGDRTERLWLLAGLALTLTAAGVIAVVATRGRRKH
ncbi:hypothetical protein HRW13_33430 [Streptomyces lunaelactis]|uniref:hypothetical protein n=1 Tax=Streptomyces lunaelactis TaxID=1535768 RepID=UPI001584B5B9|nr:hypothetical protein [Streptomyces lunaelactis]NUK45676.1 hypothetical protein [Streptomyces lunaelactis]